MINLRYHIFSLVAVFVALAIGIAAGSTVVRGPLLDSTRSRLDAAEKIIEQERQENDVLTGELSQLDQLSPNALLQLLPGHLTDRQVIVVVSGDVEGDVVDGVLLALSAASATVAGEVRIEPPAFDPAQVARVAAAVGMAPPAKTGEEPDAGQVAAVHRAFGERVAALLGAVGTEQVGPAERSLGEALRAQFGALEDRGLLDLRALSSVTVDPDLLDVVIVTDRNASDDPRDVLEPIIDTSRTRSPDSPMLVAEAGRLATATDTPVPAVVGFVRSDGQLRDEVITVDNAETALGWIGVVLGLEAGLRGHIGHYGFRNGAEQLYPARVT